MDYAKLVQKGMENLQSKGILQKYYQRLGTETGYSARYNLEFFKRFGFKFRIIDSQEASTEITLFGKIFRTPIFSSAPFWECKDITENALTKLAIGMQDTGSMMWLG
jgi:isopentenyl diphosphate isomerase/L-lactate dehydrogenase-like FMN-dependent dehydrogenase